MNGHLVALSLFVAQVAASSAPAPESQKPTLNPEYQGCYKLTLSAWAPTMKLEGDAAFVTPPAAIELTGIPGTQGFEKDGFLVKPALGARKSIHSAAFWHTAPKTRIEIVWTTGFSGLTMDLELRGAGLIGTAETFWDFGRTTQRARVRGDRVACTAGQ